MEYCCTCTRPLPSADSDSDSNPKTKDHPDSRTLNCCARVICGKCIYDNDRFSIYCPYCQISSIPLSLPQGLRDPPSYTAKPPRGSTTVAEAPPAYSETTAATGSRTADNEKAADDTLHFLDHEHDTVVSLSLRYGVPPAALRAANNLASDHLLLGRRTILIPGQYYKAGVSLSPRPVEDDEELARKSKIRRFMTTAKVADYDVAVLYLDQANFDLDDAIEKFFADDEWERQHGKEPVASASRVRRAMHQRRTSYQQNDPGPFRKALNSTFTLNW